MDSLLHATVCKHVYLVKTVYNRQSVNSKTKDQNTTNLEYFSSILEDDLKECEL